jgi:hypothetical protein
MEALDFYGPPAGGDGWTGRQPDPTGLGPEGLCATLARAKFASGSNRVRRVVPFSRQALRRDDDTSGRRVLLPTSEDFCTWSTPVPLLHAQQGHYSELVLKAAGFHQHAEQFFAYIRCYEFLSQAHHLWHDQLPWLPANGRVRGHCT